MYSCFLALLLCALSVAPSVAQTAPQAPTPQPPPSQMGRLRPAPRAQALPSTPTPVVWTKTNALALPRYFWPNDTWPLDAWSDSAQDRGGDATVVPQNLPTGSEQYTFFPHPDSTRYWASGQINSIYQMHPNFHSPYQGTNSFTAPFQYKASEVATLMLGYELNPRPRYATEFIYDEENAGGRGLSQALGLAGFTNLDVVRNPNLGLAPYVARAELHQTIGFTDETVPQERGPLALETEVPVRRLEIRVGKMTLPDLFDVNAILGDSHLQFMDWTVDNNGAWDYAADTRGYTYAMVLEYQDRTWAVRYGIALMPTVANGITLDWALRRARGQNMELEIRKGVLPHRAARIRLLAYGNNAHMGLYREAVQHYLEGLTPTPEITSVEHFDALKYGFGINIEQNVTDNLRIGARFGWDEGQHESFAYTEDDQTFLIGGDYAGTAWRRKLDKIGVGFVTNAIKKDHQNYLKLGGLGFLLGDGRLNYAREDIVESYYDMHAWKGMYYAIGNTFIEHPGYNQDRGPVDVQTVRLHLDF